MQLNKSLIKKLCKKLNKPRTVEELMMSTGASRRTIYRWLDVLIEQGHPVRRVSIGRPAKYQIGGQL